jgi:hypothetical protein
MRTRFVKSSAGYGVLSLDSVGEFARKDRDAEGNYQEAGGTAKLGKLGQL